MYSIFNKADYIPTAGQAARIVQLLLFALVCGVSMAAQSPGSQQGPPIPRSPLTDPSMGFNEPSMMKRQVAQLNIERQKAIVSDTEKILELARELNQDANAQNPTMSGAERVHKAEEIEKLARSVREKMTNAIGMPEPVNPFAPSASR